MQGGGRMEHGNHITLAHFPHLPMHCADLGTGHEPAHGIASQRDDDARVDGFDLAFQIRITGDQFLRQRITVAGRPAFDHIPNPDIGALQTGLRQELIEELSEDYTIAIVTHNMQQAARVSDFTAFFYLGKLIEFDDTKKIFTNPAMKQTEDYITGRFG